MACSGPDLFRRPGRSGDLAVVRDNRSVLGAGWIDNIQTAAARKIRYRCPRCTSTDFKYRSKKQFTYRCATCTNEFDIAAQEELEVQVFTANYSRTFRLTDRPFPVKALDTAYIGRSQQHAIWRLDVAQLRPVLETHLVTGAPWWGSHVREDERIPSGHGAGPSKTRVGQQRFGEAMLNRFGEACAFTRPQHPGALEAAHLYLYSQNPEHDVRGGLLLRSDLHARFDRWLITIDPETWSIQIAPELKQYPGVTALDGQPSCCQKSCAHAQVHSRSRINRAGGVEVTKRSATPGPHPVMAGDDRWDDYKFVLIRLRRPKEHTGERTGAGENLVSRPSVPRAHINWIRPLA